MPGTTLPSPNAYTAPQLRQLIYYQLDNDMLQNALFFAGRLHALDTKDSKGDSAHLLALCHLRLGEVKAAYETSRDRVFSGRLPHLGCAYVFAKACFALERYSEGLNALERSRAQWSGRNHWNKHSDTLRRHLPDAAAVLCLLGKLSRANDETDKAIEYYVEALKLNAFMWDAFTDLCDCGAELRPENVFKVSMELNNSNPNLANGTTNPQPPNLPLQAQSNNSQSSVFNSFNDPFNPTIRTAGDPGLNHGGPNLFSRLNGSIPVMASHKEVNEWDTPPANGSFQDEDVVMADDTSSVHEIEPPQAPLKKPSRFQTLISEATLDPPKIRTANGRLKVKSTTSESTDSSESSRIAVPTAHKRTNSGHIPPPMNTTEQPRRSNRLRDIVPRDTISGPSRSKTTTVRDVQVKEQRELRKMKAISGLGTRGRSTSTVGRVVSGNRKPMEVSTGEVKEPRIVGHPSTATVPTNRKAGPPQPDPAKEQEQAVQWISQLLLRLGSGYYNLSRYQNQAALEIFNSLPASQRETGWVLAQIGKAHYERTSYPEAADAFSRMRKIAPSRMEDLEIYSTVLWHQKNEIELAYLSHELIDADRLSPQAWCAIGNSFSLQREHDQAVKCFKRATQLDPKFAYAYTLQGHEHVENEEFDKAQHAYRCAISADHRHYHGWYGLGRVYERLGKFDVAEKHYRSAAQINPTNAVLAVRIGTVLQKMKKIHAALTQYSHACDLDPRPSLSRFARLNRARALLTLGRPQDALGELTVLKDIAPDVANVHFLLGRTYKMLRERSLAVKYFTNALNLDPKAAAYIKEAMETIDDDDDFYDDDEDGA
ncbi:TPR-like protein [Eremomyces bilateralis CBS 781.70]|uniref:TPR-like protein n=1 Tax=Eremomyces bilateralis CBS 781.70 TaxID=1392243 RepID=A0A6G1GEX9_9PEZI|nr:TPR-like protein [Eremomyces bilateralis CBS 781.70]KAF1816618.1 TPR-like protein [Eremomyces bilateralis CBS 781.70]